MAFKNLDLGTSGESTTMSSTRANHLFLLFFIGLRFLQLKKTEFFANQLSTNSTLDNTGHPLPEFDARTPNNLTSLRITVRMVAKFQRPFFEVSAPMGALTSELLND